MTKNGDVLGLLGWPGDEEDGWPVASAVDVLDRANQMIDGEDPSGLGDRPLPSGGGSRVHNIVLQSIRQTETFIARGSSDHEDLRLEITPELATFVSLTDANRGPREVGVIQPGQKWVADVSSYATPIFLTLAGRADLMNSVHISSTLEFVRYTDIDDGREVQVGGNVFGALDHTDDADTYFVELLGGQVVGIQTRSVSNAPVFNIDDPDEPTYAPVFTVNWDERQEPEKTSIKYRAPESGRYRIKVQYGFRSSAFGYILSVWHTNDATGAESPINDTVAESPFGLMARYQSKAHGFQLSYPAVISLSSNREGLTFFAVGSRGEVFAVKEGRRYQAGPITIEEYGRASTMSEHLPLVGTTIVSKREFRTEQGLAVLVEDIEADGGRRKGSRLIYHEGNLGLIAVIFAPTAVYDELKDAIEYSFSTFLIAEAGEPLYGEEDAGNNPEP